MDIAQPTELRPAWTPKRETVAPSEEEATDSIHAISKPKLQDAQP